MPGDNFGNNVFLWGTALLNAVSAYVSHLKNIRFRGATPNPVI